MMPVEKNLKLYILQKYKSVSAFSKALNIPNTTINSILKRGIGGTAISTVNQICKNLNIDIQALSEGEIKPKHKYSDIEIDLSVDEQEMIYKYRCIDYYSQNNIKFILENEYNRELQKTNFIPQKQDNFLTKIVEGNLPAIARSLNSYEVNSNVNITKNEFVKKIENLETIKKDEDF